MDNDRGGLVVCGGPGVSRILGEKTGVDAAPGLLWLHLNDFYEVPPAGDRVILTPNSDASQRRPSRRVQVCSIL